MMYSRHANGGLTIRTKVSSAIAKNPPIARTGFVATCAEVTMTPPTDAAANVRHVPM